MKIFFSALEAAEYYLAEYKLLLAKMNKLRVGKAIKSSVFSKMNRLRALVKKLTKMVKFRPMFVEIKSVDQLLAIAKSGRFY